MFHQQPTKRRPKKLSSMFSYRRVRARLSLLSAVLVLGGSCKTYDPIQVQSGASGGVGTGGVTGTFGASSTWSSSANSSSVSSSSSGGKAQAQGCIPAQQLPCAQDPLGSPVRFPGGVPRGNCRRGQKTCLASGQWGACLGVVGPYPQDDCSVRGDDANCNGAPNDGCDCVSSPGAQRPCGSNVGACEQGLQYCVVGIWGDCIGEKAPQKELCDGKGVDEDCDGKTDIADNDCECLDGQAIQCTLGEDRGDCSLGERRCSGGVYGACVALFEREPERCGRREPDAFGRATGDEDCDGQIDELIGDEPPLGCKIYLEDKDEDTWGAVGPSYQEDQKIATWGCFCSPPTGAFAHFVPAWKRDRENTDCGECQVGGEFVHPGIFAVSEEPSACLMSIGWKGGPFDYNCDGKQEPFHQGIRQGQCQGDPESSRGCSWADDSIGFWLGHEPNCGAFGLAPECLPKGEPGKRICAPSTTPDEHRNVRQSCR